jgi:hypothetical protein
MSYRGSPDEPPASYKSPAGTYERILKVILEDPTLTDSEFRLLAYLATKPAGWQLREEQLMRALGRPLNWVQTARSRLRKRGLLTEMVERSADNSRIERRYLTLCRDLVLSGSTAGDSSSGESLDQVTLQPSPAWLESGPPYREDGRYSDYGNQSETPAAPDELPPDQAVPAVMNGHGMMTLQQAHDAGVSVRELERQQKERQRQKEQSPDPELPVPGETQVQSWERMVRNRQFGPVADEIAREWLACFPDIRQSQAAARQVIETQLDGRRFAPVLVAGLLARMRDTGSRGYPLSANSLQVSSAMNGRKNGHVRPGAVGAPEADYDPRAKVVL